MSPSSQLAIRRGETVDLPAVLKLLQGAGLPTEDLSSAPGLHLWVLEVEESLVGVIGLERFGASALLRSLAIAPEHRRRGWGQQLVDRLEHDASGAGVQRLVLLTETGKEFFHKLGYEILDRRCVSDDVQQSAEFRSLCPALALCMSKSLDRGVA
jgi:amino-acid N-acetyltransferase